MTPYDSMSKEQLINALVDHDATLSEIYNIIHLHNKVMAPGEKLFWIAARNVLAREKPNEDGLVRLPTEDISAFNGMSDGSNNRYANSTIERFGAKKVPIPYTTLKGQSRDLIYVDRSDPLWHSPWDIDLPEEKERTINGNGKECPRCKTYNLQVKTHRIKYQEVQECDCCGYTKISPILDDKQPLNPGEYIPEEKGLQAGEPFGSEEKAQKSDALTSINTPPIAAQEKKVSSLKSFLLERIGNPEQKLIVATGKSSDERKYTSLPLDQGPDLEKYLVGDPEHIYGSGLADKDGMTYQLDFDLDELEEYTPHEQYQKELARAGISSFLAHRANNRAHLVVPFNEKVNAESAKASCLAACPCLAHIEECYPTGGKHNGRISWPFWQRRGDTVTACPLDFVFASKPDEVLKHGGIKAPNSLPYLIERTINDASLIPALPGEETPQKEGWVLLDIPSPTRNTCPYDDGLKADILASARQLSWAETVNGAIRGDRFCASWRGEDKPSVVINGEYATDFGRTQSGHPEPHDKFDIYWLTRGKNPRVELKRLIDILKLQRERRAS
jgi:hypothetical protein